MKWLFVADDGFITRIAYASIYEEPQIPKHFEGALCYLNNNVIYKYIITQPEDYQLN